MKLYKLTGKYNQVLEMAEQEDSELLKDTLESIDDTIEVKIENVAKVIVIQEGNIAAVDSEIKRLTARKSTLTNNKDGLKRYLQEEMEKVGKEKVKGQLFNVSIRKNAPSVKVINESLIPKGYFVPQPPKLNKKELLQDLKNGDEYAGAELQRTRSLQIR
ncbi:siphovirus Gp157 family protein [Enterococcus larvae]|uniref:siphovirus Gp157 family protein n=1 Tax=Enterococcus larvae TaxID=2794352 RepID=UPI003F3D777D